MKHKVLGKVSKEINNSDFDILPVFPMSDISNRLFKYVELTTNENKRGAISKHVTEIYSE